MFSDTPSRLAAGAVDPATPRVMHDLRGIFIYPPARTVVQAKLRTNPSGDEYELEADRVSRQVMESSPAGPEGIGSMGGGGATDGETTDGEASPLQTKPVRPGGNAAGLAVSPVLLERALSGGGQPLGQPVRRFMEQRFGHDFSRIRVHDDAHAAALSGSLNARAVATGPHIVFGRGEYAPESTSGRALLAHEMTHVLQQGFDAGPGAMQRDKKDGDDKKADPVKDADQQISALLGNMEANWKTLAAIANRYDLLKPWVAAGAEALLLLRTHTAAELGAIRSGDNELVAAYGMAVGTDKVMFDYISWHVTAYVNLLSLRSTVDSLVTSFDHDNRQFTGRANAESITRALKAAIDGLPASSSQELSLIRLDVPMGVRSGTPSAVTIMVTSPAIDPKVDATFKMLTAKARALQVQVQQEAAALQQFLNVAYAEGLAQAEEAVKEYINVRRALEGGNQSEEENNESQRQPNPGGDISPVPHPVPNPSPGDDKKKKKEPTLMRFQVQWNSRAKGNKKGQFSGTATAPGDVGVSVAQALVALGAVHAQVVPSAAKKAATPAVAKQAEWISKRPPAGIAQGGYSKSAYFLYDYPDARVDVENMHGHNLKF